MLHEKAADANTRRVLDQLMQDSRFKDFHLCGGTCLALLYGHRLSIDIDLFTKTVFDKSELKSNLQDLFEDFKEEFSPASIFYFCYLNQVKSDFIYSRPKVISPFVEIEGIRMWGIKDIIAMKLSAIYGRGSKKDFWDIDELLNHFSIVEMVDLFFQKSPEAFEEGLMMSLLYFDDADQDKDPLIFNNRNWSGVKKRIEDEVYKNFKIRR
ncbi:nucleotidyl transferase AbiEii/AbiGii toxin family protein [soil metagenome]